MQYVFYYKLGCLLAGCLLVTLGYKLFVKGVFNESGDVEGSWRDYKLIVRKAAPGTYFVLFGSIIIAFAVFKGLEVKESEGYNNADKVKPTSAPPSIDTLVIDTTNTD
jgi:hypothetical protein